MASDRFIQFPKGKKPSADDVETALKAYVNGVGTVTRVGNDLVSVSLPGESFTVAGAFPGHEWIRAADRYESRGFEVNLTTTFDVITRRGDEFSCALANGFCEFAARFWGGTRESTD